MNKILLSMSLLLAMGSLVAQNTVSSEIIDIGYPTRDPVSYPTIYSENRDMHFLSNSWLYSAATSNFFDRGARDSDIQGLTYAEGLIYLAGTSRQDGSFGLNLFNVYSGVPIGERIGLASILSRILSANAIHTDAGGNLVISSRAEISRGGPLRVWIMKNETDTLKMILEFSFKDNEAEPRQIDYLSVYGDLTKGDAYIIAAVSSSISVGDERRVYRWDFTDGVYQPADESGNPAEIYIRSYFPTTTSANGSYPFILPVSKTLFYLDTANSEPALYNMHGMMLDSFSNAPEDIIRPDGTANGLAEFVSYDQHFLVMGAGTTKGDYKHAFHLYKMGKGGTFKDMKLLYTFPKYMTKN